MRKSREKRWLALILSLVMVCTTLLSNGILVGASKSDSTENIKETTEQPQSAEDTDTVIEDILINDQTSVSTTEDVKEEQEDKEETPAAKTEYTYEDEEVFVTARLENTNVIPNDAEFHVEKITDYDTMQEIGNKLWDQAREENKNLETFVAYDICFLVNGMEVEPEGGSVKVKIIYKEPLKLKEEAIQSETNVYHFDESSDEVIIEKVNANVKNEDNGEIREIEYVVNSFSVQTIAEMSMGAQDDGIVPYLKVASPKLDDGIELKKEAVENNDGTWTLNLEAYTTGKVTKTGGPVDIVLTLDMSGSMWFTMGKRISYEKLDKSKPDNYYRWGANNNDFGNNYRTDEYNCLRYRNGWQIYKGASWPNDGWYDLSDYQGYQNADYYVVRLAALKESVNNFIDNVASDAVEKSVDSRVAIAKFSGDSINYKVSDDFLLVNNEENVTRLKDLIESLNPSGATPTDKGLEEAYNYFNNDTRKAEKERAKVSVLFTDGVPTTSNSFSSSVAKKAIQYTYKIKHEFNAYSYSIGIFSGANPEANLVPTGTDEQKANVFMHYVSSNYPNANPGDRSNWYENAGEGSNQGYYLATSEAEQLNKIFDDLSHSIGGAVVDLGTETVLKDVISDEFVLAGSMESVVSVKTYKYLGNGKFANNGEDITNRVSAAYDSATKSVNVTGYDYSKNFVIDGDGEDVQTSGEKIVLSLKIKRNESTYGGNKIATNKSDSGIYDKSNDKLDEFPIPEVNVPVLYETDAKDKSIYLTQDANTNQIGMLPAIRKDSYNSTVNIDCWPNGTNNEYVDITYYVLDSEGNVVATKTVSHGQSLTENPFDYVVKGLTENTVYQVKAKVVSANVPIDGFTPTEEVEDIAQGTIYVFKPVIEATDEGVFWGDSTDLTERITGKDWVCNVSSAPKPEGTAPELNYEFTLKEGTPLGTDIKNYEPEMDSNFNVEVICNGQNITKHTEIVKADQNTDDHHFTIYVVKGQLIIIKKIGEQYTDIQKTKANQSFIFKIERRDKPNGAVIDTFYEVISFDANGAVKEKSSATIGGLKKGYYTVTEETKWSSKYSLKTVSNNYNEESNAKDLYIGEEQGENYYYGLEQSYVKPGIIEGRGATAAFTNEINKGWKWLSDVAAAVNKFVS